MQSKNAKTNKTRKKIAPDPANYVHSKIATKSAAKATRKQLKWDHTHLPNQSGRQLLLVVLSIVQKIDHPMGALPVTGFDCIWLAVIQHNQWDWRISNIVQSYAYTRGSGWSPISGFFFWTPIENCAFGAKKKYVQIFYHNRVSCISQKNGFCVFFSNMHGLCQRGFIGYIVCFLKYWIFVRFLWDVDLEECV